MSEVFSAIFGVMVYAVGWMKLTYVPGVPITFYQLWCGALVTTSLVDALKTFLPNQNEGES